MTRYYIMDSSAERGFIEVTESEYISLVGTDETRPYVGKLYRGEIIADEIPEDIREKVVEIVSNRIARFGAYTERSVSDAELAKLIKEVL